MKTITVSIPVEEVIKVQRADIECSSRKNIITTILEKDINIPQERFDAYQKEYDDKFFAFEQAKTNIEKNYVRTKVNNPKDWSLDYNSGILTINYMED